MKKINMFTKLLVTLLFAFTPFINTNAASATVNLTASSTKVVTGNTVKIYVNTYSSSPLGSLEYDISYNSSVLKLQSVSTDLCSSKHCIWYTSSSNTKSTTYTFTFKAIGSGSSSVTVKNAYILGYDEKKMSTNVSPVTVKVITQEELEASYSKDNNLTSLTVSGHELSPKFDKNTTNYTLELDSLVESIKVSATKSDSKASVKGTGTINVSEGENTIKVVVTAENGSKKTYTIVATVKELNPIKVNVKDKEYTIVKKAKLLTAPDNYVSKEITIEETKIPAFYNEINDYTLVGLKDSEGKIELFLYNEDGTYKEYIETKFSGTSFQIIETDENIPDGYKEAKVTINETEYKAYKDTEDSEFALIYGRNLNTGEYGFYKYDTKENTLQRFNERDINKIVNNLEEEYKLVLLTIGGILVCILLVVIFSGAASSVKKKKRKSSKSNIETKEKIKEELDEEEKEIKKEAKSKAKKSKENKRNRKRNIRTSWYASR